LSIQSLSSFLLRQRAFHPPLERRGLSSPFSVTTIREQERALPELHRILMRNATVHDLTRLQTERVGTTFQADGRRYRVVEVYRDQLNRLIAVGTLEA